MLCTVCIFSRRLLIGITRFDRRSIRLKNRVRTSPNTWVSVERLGRTKDTDLETRSSDISTSNGRKRTRVGSFERPRQPRSDDTLRALIRPAVMAHRHLLRSAPPSPHIFSISINSWPIPFNLGSILGSFRRAFTWSKPLPTSLRRYQDIANFAPSPLLPEVRGNWLLPQALQPC